MKRPGRIGVIIAASGIILAALAFLVMPLFGVHAYVITGASMSGYIDRGALILTRTVPVDTLEVGDVITFQPPGDSANVTHRIISVERQADGGAVFKTKGDFNESVDPWQFTLDRPVQAKYWLQIPYLGYALALLNLRFVRALLFAVPVLAAALMLFAFLWRNSGEARWFSRSDPVVPEGGEATDLRRFRRVDRRR